MEVPDADLNGALNAVKYDFDPVAAKNLIEYFHDRICDGEPFNERVLLEYVGHAFEQIIVHGKSADQAFGLRRSRGQREREDHTERDIAGAACVVLLMRKGWRWADAIGEAANYLCEDGKGDKAIEHAYSVYREVLSLLADQKLEAMLPDGIQVEPR